MSMSFKTLTASAVCLVIGITLGTVMRSPEAGQLVFEDTAHCPCDFEGYVNEEWDAVCAAQPYSMENAFRQDGVARQAEPSGNDAVWTLAFYQGESPVRSFAVLRSDIELGGGTTCVARSQAESRMEGGKFLLLSREGT